MSKTTFRVVVCALTAIVLTVTVLAVTVFPAPIGLALLAGMVVQYALSQARDWWREA